MPLTRYSSGVMLSSCTSARIPLPQAMKLAALTFSSTSMAVAPSSIALMTFDAWDVDPDASPVLNWQVA